MAPPDIRRTGTSRRAQYNRFTGYVLATAGAIVGAALLGISLWQPRSFSGPRNLMHDAVEPASAPTTWLNWAAPTP